MSACGRLPLFWGKPMVHGCTAVVGLLYCCSTCGAARSTFQGVLHSCIATSTAASFRGCSTVVLPPAPQHLPGGTSQLYCHQYRSIFQGVLHSCTAACTAAPARGYFTLRIRLEEVGVIAAAQSIGVTFAAAQTCQAMLSRPGGVYLDIKSAYSSPRDIQQFVTTMKGVGVHCKAVCSFQMRQLNVGGLVDSVLFFHGISGLENSCDDGRCRRGQFVLFNGASFLADLKPAALKTLPAASAKAVLTESTSHPIDAFVLRKYLGLCETYCFAGGIYVQEPDASPAAISALAQLVAAYPEYFPLGFAYGHLSGLGVSFLDQNGRGFAAQQLVEEFQSRKEMSGKVISSIRKGKHREVTLSTTIAWGQRLLFGSPVMSLTEQRAFITLLSQIWPHKHVKRVVEELGGIPRIFLRFFEHYELTTPLTILEAGFNMSHTKDLIRVLRNRGTLAAMTPAQKVELAKFFCSRQLRGYGLTWVLMMLHIRVGLHKFAKEGLCCVLESCTAHEYAQVVSALGGARRVDARLRGRLHLSWRYSSRLRDVEGLHAGNPHALAYQESALRYAALPYARSSADAKRGAADPCHTRNKTKRERTLRFLRKVSCDAFTGAYVFGLSLITCFTFLCCCVGPRVYGAAGRGILGLLAVLAFLGFVTMVVLLAVLLSADDGDPCDDPVYNAAHFCECNPTLCR